MNSRLFCRTSKFFEIAVRNASYVPLIDGVRPVLLSSDIYVENGNADGIPVLVTHGLCGSKANWMYVARGLANKCKPKRKIIVTDVRNHGDSPHADEHSYAHMCADFNYLMDVNGIEKATVMGHSMGGRCAMYFCLTHAERTEKAIVLDVSPVNHKKESEFSFIKSLLESMHDVRFPKDVMKSEARVIVNTQLAVTVPNPNLRQFLLTNLKENEDGSYGWRLNLPVLIENFFANIRTFPDVTGKVFDGPVMFLVGEKSDFVRPKDYAFIKKLFPNVNTVTIPDAGHWLHSQKPNEIIENCVAFLND